MATIVTRAGKGSALTHTELDANFTNLNTDKIELTNLSVTDSGGDGSLSYNNSTGVITYTGPSAAEVRAHISTTTASASGGGALAYNSSTGVLTFTPAVPGTATTINNNADNRIITGSGSANTLEGESTLLYDGTSLSNTTAPTFTEASTPIQLNGTQPNAGGYFAHTSINNQTSRGAIGYRGNTAAGGSAKVDTHMLYFDLDDDFGLRPGGSFQGDRNIWFQANHTADQLSIYMDGFSNNTIESFDGNNGSYARTPIELHGSTTTLKAGGTTALTATSSTLTAGVELDMNGETLKMGGGTLDLEGGTFSMGGADLDMGGGSLKDTAGSLNIEALVAHEVTSAATVTYNMNNKSATGLGMRIQGGTSGTGSGASQGTVHTTGDLLLVEKSVQEGSNQVFTTLFEAKSDKDSGSWSGATGQTKAENLHLTGLDVDTTQGIIQDARVKVNINGSWYYMSLQTT